MHLDYLASPMVISARSFVNACGATWDVSNEEETRRSYEHVQDIVREAANAGFGEYRAHLDSWTLPPAPTASATTPTGGSSKGSRTPSIPTGSWRRASSRSGQRPTERTINPRRMPDEQEAGREGRADHRHRRRAGPGRGGQVRRGGRAGHRLRPVRGWQPGNGRYRGGRRRHDDRDGPRRPQRSWGGQGVGGSRRPQSTGGSMWSTTTPPRRGSC